MFAASNAMRRRTRQGVQGLALTMLFSASAAQADEWEVVANNATEIPNTDPVRYFNSYNPPSINNDGLVVFRARSTGQQQGPVSGVYTRSMEEGGPVQVMIDRQTSVPSPANITYPPDDELATFTEFPAFPRIAADSDVVATRAQTMPTWRYTFLDPASGEVLETRVGTTGVYANPGGQVVTGASQLGTVPASYGEPPEVGTNYFPYFEVPGQSSATRFDQFPGSPSSARMPDGRNMVVFKGNFAVEDAANPGTFIGKTGVFYREVSEGMGGTGVTKVIASSDTPIPNPGACAPGTTFGSTAPPSAADYHVAFVGLDNEDAPTCGGIYMSRMEQPNRPMQALVSLQTPVPGQGGQTFTRIGEALSFDGRFLSFWGAWGTATKRLLLDCPTDGNSDRLAYCQACVGDDYPVDVPVHQGIFVMDTWYKRLHMVADAGSQEGFDDFLFWNFSGAPPLDPTQCTEPPAGSGEDREPPRWRASAFSAVQGTGNGHYLAAFQARSGAVVAGSYDSPNDGIYFSRSGYGPYPVVNTADPGTYYDPAAVDATTGEPLPVIAVGLERDALRGNRLAVSISMGTDEAGWAGIYVRDLVP